MGFRSGDYGGRKTRSLPQARSTSRAWLDLWADRFSATTICPGRSVGASWLLMSASKLARFIAPSRTQGAISPS